MVMSILKFISQFFGSASATTFSFCRQDRYRMLRSREKVLCSTPDHTRCKAVSSLLSISHFIPSYCKNWGIFSHSKSGEHGTGKIPFLAVALIRVTTKQLHL